MLRQDKINKKLIIGTASICGGIVLSSMKQIFLIYLFFIVIIFAYSLLYYYTSYASAEQGFKYHYVVLKKDNDTTTMTTTVNTTKTPTSPSINKIVYIVQGASDMGGKGFSPNSVHTKVGDTVVWKNNDYDIHTVTEGREMGEEPEDGFESGVLKPSQVFDNTFANAGTIGYHCMLHPTMLGTIVVSP